MPILLILFITSSCLPLPWPDRPFGLTASQSTVLTFVTMAIPILVSMRLSHWVVRTLRRDPDQRPRVVARYAKVRRTMILVNLGAAIICVLGWGWGATVWETFTTARPSGQVVLYPGAELLVPLPYFLTIFLNWIIYHGAERALHQSSYAVREGRKSPVFWSVFAFFGFHLRQFLLMIALPVGMCVVQQSLARVAPEWSNSAWMQFGSVGFGIVLFMLLPLAVPPLLGLKPLPDGYIRQRLEATAARSRIRFTDILVWHTQGAMANAMVIGVVPWARYVIFTDRLLETMPYDELDAVFGHEAGHVRHRHIPYYAAFIVLSASLGTAVFALLEQGRANSGWVIPSAWQQWLSVLPLVGMGTYLFVVFGLLSRRCERQADIYGCRAGSCANPNCYAHDEDTVIVPNGQALCRTGINSLIRALDRVADLHGLDSPSSGQRGKLLPRVWSWVRAWQHGPMSSRIEFLQRVIEDPTLGDRTDRRVGRFRILLAVALVTSILALGTYIGWAELWKMM